MPSSSRARAASDADCHLVLPEFTPRFQRMERRWPQLQRLFKYADAPIQTTTLELSLQPWQVEVLGALRLDAGSMASAPLTWLGLTGEFTPGWWAHADPCVLTVSAQGLSMQGGKWSDTEFERFAAATRSTLAELGLKLRRVAGRTFVHRDAPIDVRTVAPRHAVGNSLREMLPTGEQAVTLRRLMTDLQMLIHQTCPDAAFNSVWIWGGGNTPAASMRDLPSVATDDPFVLGIYRASEAVHRSASFQGGSTPISELVVAPGDSMNAESCLDDTLRALESGRVRTANVYLDGCWLRARYSVWRRWFANDRELTTLPV